MKIYTAVIMTAILVLCCILTNKIIMTAYAHCAYCQGEIHHDSRDSRGREYHPWCVKEIR